MAEFDDKVYIVTGATSGMGKAVATMLGLEGASIVINGRNEEKGRQELKRMENQGINCVWEGGDVGTDEVNKRLVESALANFGKIDGVVANAGTLGLGALTEVGPDIWHDTINVNLQAVYYVARHVLPVMQKQGKGNLLVNASIAAFKSFPNHPAYCAAKAGAVALVKQIAADYGKYGIRANAMCPGPVDTPLIWDSAKAFPDPSKAVENAGMSTAIGRLGLPDDIASLALFLLSDQSSWITGTAVTIDGGTIFR